MKRCTGCDFTKPTSEFYATSGGKSLMGKCKECWKAQVRKHRRESERPREYDRERDRYRHRVSARRANTIKWRADNPEAYKAETMVGLHAHHEDYSKPLAVIWLCSLHHHRLKAKE